MNPKVQITTEYLNQLKPFSFMEDEKIKERFIHNYKATHAGCSDEEAEDFYNIESMHYKRIVNANADLQRCTMFSLYASFIDIIVSGLTFDPAADLIYVLFDNFNIGSKDNPSWEKRAKNEISPYGELGIRIQRGQLKYADDPVIVFDCDVWEPGYREDGTRYCLYKAKLPRPANAVIIGSFVKLTRADGSFDIPWFTIEQINEWKAASNTKNRNKGANTLYGGDNTGNIHMGFLKAKTIKHAFKGMPKLKLAMANTSLEGTGNMEVSPAGELVETKPAATTPAPPVFTPVQTPAQQAPPPPFNFSAAPPPAATPAGTFTVDAAEFTDAPF